MTPTLNGKRQRIKFPQPKLIYFIHFFDYGNDLRCDLTNNFFLGFWPLVKTNLTLNSRKFFRRNLFQNCQTPKFLSKIVRFFRHPEVSTRESFCPEVLPEFKSINKLPLINLRFSEDFSWDRSKLIRLSQLNFCCEIW